MPEDVDGAVTPPTEPVADATEQEPAEKAGSSVSAAPTAPAPTDGVADPTRYLDLADAKRIRRHPVIASLIGSEMERARREERERLDAEAADKATKAERERLRNLRRTDPLAYADEMEAKEAASEYQESLQRLRGETRSEFARRIGQAYQRVPEWAELGESDHEALAKSVRGLPDDEVIGAYNAAALELLAEKRAAKRHQEWRERDLPKEREALRKEVAAELLKGDTAPDLRRGGPAPTSDEPDWQSQPRAWEAWYARKYGR